MPYPLAAVRDKAYDRARLPFSDTFDRTIGALGNGWIVPGTAAISGNALVITPSATAAGELLTNGGFEGTYTAGLAPNWNTAGSPTIAESADAHGGTAAQQAQNATATDLIYQNVTAPAGWVRYSAWAKRLSGTGNNISVSQRQNTDTNNFSEQYVTSATYAQYVSTICLKAGQTQARLRVYTGADVVVEDDASMVALTMATTGVYRRKAGAAYCVSVVAAARLSGVPYGCWGVVDNPANPQNGVFAYLVASTLRLAKILNGTITFLVEQAVTFNISSAVAVTRAGNSYQLQYAGANVGAAQTVDDAAIVSGQYVGILSTGAESTIDNFSLTPT